MPAKNYGPVKDMIEDRAAFEAADEAVRHPPRTPFDMTAKELATRNREAFERGEERAQAAYHAEVARRQAAVDAEAAYQEAQAAMFAAKRERRERLSREGEARRLKLVADLRRLRAEAGITIQEMAIFSGGRWSKETLGNYEREGVLTRGAEEIGAELRTLYQMAGKLLGAVRGEIKAQARDLRAAAKAAKAEASDDGRPE